ncbi:MAG: phosphatase PAP2 family protein [Gemmatimonadales bacterium]|nr:phosphatase PAP2 family protein [Gemmatimonadales bacterium]
MMPSAAVEQSASDQMPVTVPSVSQFVWRELRLLVVLGALSFGAALCVRYGLHYPIPLTDMSVPRRMRQALRYTALLGPVLLLIRLLRQRLALRGADGRPVPGRAGWSLALAALRQDALAARFALVVSTVLVMAGLFSVFALWKASIPVLAPWRWDPMLVAVERALHGGVLPQDVTRSWFGPRATVVLDDLYSLWLRLVALFVVWQSLRAPAPGRMRALLALALTYTLLGNVGGMLLSSGGPVYYDRLVGESGPYAAQAAYLAAIPGLHATAMQRSIWDWVQSGTYVPFATISAMPSMHVGVTTVMALACRERNRWFGVAGWLYVCLILLGSVHLNWHYAIDGYVAIVGVLAVWWFSGWLVRRYA